MFATKVEVADTFIKRFFGLMGRSDLDMKGGLILKPCNRIHTMFMKFPIDCLYLDKENRVIHMETLEPWKVGKIVKDCTVVIELPKGAIERFKINLNQKIMY